MSDYNNRLEVDRMADRNMDQQIASFDVLAAPEVWTYDHDNNFGRTDMSIEVDGAAVALVYGADSFPCVDESDFEAVAKECLQHARLFATAAVTNDALRETVLFLEQHKAALIGAEVSAETYEQVVKPALAALAEERGEDPARFKVRSADIPASLRPRVKDCAQAITDALEALKGNNYLGRTEEVRRLLKIAEENMGFIIPAGMFELETGDDA